MSAWGQEPIPSRTTACQLSPAPDLVAHARSRLCAWGRRFLILLQPQFLNRPFLFRDLLHRESPVVFSTQIEALLV
jgi:hypothetical protein